MAELRELIDQLHDQLEGEARFDAVSRMLYRTDASIYEIPPRGLVLPKNAEDVVRLTRLAAEHGIALLPRGGGTSLAGQAVGDAIHVDFTPYMHRILEVNPQEQWVWVEPGLVLDQLNAHVGAQGLVFGPDVATSSRATIGGMIGNNSSGAHSLLYGKTSDHVLELDVVLADGTRTTLRPLADDELDSVAGRSDPVGRLHSGIREVVEPNRALIDQAFPRVMRRVSGYNLDSFVRDGARFDLGKLVSGSEGTLCTVVGAKLRLVERTPHTVLVACHFHDLIEAMQANLVALETSPAAVELTDKVLMDLTRNSPEHAPTRVFMEGDPAALLFVEYFGDREDQLEMKMDELEDALRQHGLGYAYVRARDPGQQKRMWELRKAGLGVLNSMKGDAKPVAGLEDTCVPVDCLPEYVERVRTLMAEDGVEAVFYAHVSVGVLHIRPILDLKDPRGIKQLRSLEERISDIVREYGGSMSAEHGDGLARSEWIPKMFGPEIVRLFERVKDTFDPQGIMNPGKIVRAGPMDQNLRYGPHYAHAQPETFFLYKEEGGLQRAVEMCSGVGHCRKLDAGTMCPSFTATRDEEHSTRGRANALRAALSGNLDAAGLTSEQLYRVMDLCLGCKGCKGECPTGVDMARLKFEFLAHYGEKHGYSLRSRIFSRIDLLSRMGSMFAPLSNWIAASRATGWMLDRCIGIDGRRQMPRFTRHRFSKWFKAKSARRAGENGDVVLFHDTYAEYSEPQVAIAATLILEQAGFRVVLAEDKVCCGRPLISKGFLRQARRNACHNVAALYPYVEKGLPIVGLEPSCILTLRDEYPDLVDDPRACKVAAGSFMLEEFLADLADQGQLQLEFTQTRKSILIHGHCQQKALVGTSPTVKIMNLPPNYQAMEIDSGCCGLAGSFGYEKEHYELSMKIGEERLFPAIRTAGPEVEIVGVGTSCRHQIADGTGRKARHWAEVLVEAL